MLHKYESLTQHGIGSALVSSGIILFTVTWKKSKNRRNKNGKKNRQSMRGISIVTPQGTQTTFLC